MGLVLAAGELAPRVPVQATGAVRDVGDQRVEGPGGQRRQDVLKFALIQGEALAVGDGRGGRVAWGAAGCALGGLGAAGWGFGAAGWGFGAAGWGFGAAECRGLGAVGCLALQGGGGAVLGAAAGRRPRPLVGVRRRAGG